MLALLANNLPELLLQNGDYTLSKHIKRPPRKDWTMIHPFIFSTHFIPVQDHKVMEPTSYWTAKAGHIQHTRPSHGNKETNNHALWHLRDHFRATNELLKHVRKKTHTCKRRTLETQEGQGWDLNQNLISVRIECWPLYHCVAQLETIFYTKSPHQ